MAAAFLLPTGEGPMAKTKQVEAVEDGLEIMIAIPIGVAQPDGYEAKQATSGRVNLSKPTLHIEAQLGAEAAMVFLRVRNGLRERNAKMANGKPVWTNVDALRWVMEQISAEVA
jgi:hypothetical protein